MLCETQGSEEALFSRFWLFWRPAGVPTAHAAFCGLCCNLSVFYDFIFCFFHYNLILRTAQSLQSFFRHSLFASHYLYLYQVVPIFLFFLCTTIWLCRTKSLAAFQLAFSWISFKAPISLCTNFFDCADNAQLQPFCKRSFIEL